MSLLKTFAAVCLICSTAGAQAAVCLNSDQIQNSDSPDGKVLILKMKNGKVWHTALKPTCSGISTFGFSWDVHGGQVCEGSQILRVLHTGEICAIGKFVPGDASKHS